MRVAYTRRPSPVPRVHSVHQETLSGTECYLGKKEKDLAYAKFLKLPEKKTISEKRVAVTSERPVHPRSRGKELPETSSALAGCKK